MTVYRGTEVIVEFTPMTCPIAGCGVTYALDEAFRALRRRDKGTWYCPNGHSLWYGDAIANDQQKLRDAKAREVALRDQLEAAARDAEAARAALLRDRQRFVNGVCPCCNRSFDNVRRHMASKHPDYDAMKVQQPAAARFRCSCGRSFESLRGLRIHQGWQRDERWFEPSAPAWRAHLTRV